MFNGIGEMLSKATTQLWSSRKVGKVKLLTAAILQESWYFSRQSICVLSHALALKKPFSCIMFFLYLQIKQNEAPDSFTNFPDPVLLLNPMQKLKWNTLWNGQEIVPRMNDHKIWFDYLFFFISIFYIDHEILKL